MKRSTKPLPRKAPALTLEQYETIRAALKRRRTESGLTLRALAELSGLSFQAISLIETGHNAPALGTLAALAEAMGCRLRDLVDAV